MPCACNSSERKNAGAKKCVVLSNKGIKVKTYSNTVEANAHAQRIGGKVTCS